MMGSDKLEERRVGRVSEGKRTFSEIISMMKLRRIGYIKEKEKVRARAGARVREVKENGHEVSKAMLSFFDCLTQLNILFCRETILDLTLRSRKILTEISIPFSFGKFGAMVTQFDFKKIKCGNFKSSSEWPSLRLVH